MRRLTEHSRDPLIEVARALVDDRPLPYAMRDVTVLDWDALASRAEHERLAPILYEALRGGAAPAPVLARLRTAWTAAERQHLLADVQLREILGALGDAGIETIVLKGPAVAAEYYGDPALRPFTDLDLLVRRSDREHAIDVLGRLGYTHGSPGRSLAYELRHAPAAYFVGGASRIPIDLHWDFVRHPGAGRATDLVVDEIWSRARFTKISGQPARALAVEDLLVYLTTHLAIHHSLVGVLWQADVALVLRRANATIDWDAVVSRAERWGAAGAVYFALRVVAERLRVMAPTAVMSRLRPGALRVAALERLLAAGPERLARMEYLVGVLLLDRFADVARVVGAGLVPTPGWLRSRYGSSSVRAAYGEHYRRLAGAVARALARQSVHPG